ncbi:hypothetical protein B0J14DRAFT_491773, partial [Halenospora varia]
SKPRRIGMPKVRTGCSTCKIRHVKCDETKPACLRCTKFGFECSGYPSIRQPTSQPRFLAPLTPLAPDFSSSTSFSVLRISAARFRSEQDLRYFRFFCEEAATHIAGPYQRSKSLWSNLIPQASESIPFVHHAIVALGAFSKVSKETRNFLLPEEGGIKDYRKALQGMRQATEIGDHDTKTLLLATVLAFCIETLQGAQLSACTLANKALVLLATRSIDYNTKAGRVSQSSSRPFEDELLYACGSLDLHLLNFLDQRPLDVHEKAVESLNAAIRNMPTKFLEMSEAVEFFQLLNRRNLHFKNKAQSIGKAAELAGRKEELGWEETADFTHGEIPAKNTWKTWYVITSWNYLLSRELLLTCQTSVLDLAGIAFTTETAYDTFPLEFRDIVQGAKIIYPELVKSSQNSALYQFEVALLPALYLVGSKCRDRTIRNEAIKLLSSSPYREGPWDSAVVHMVTWLRDIEEEGAGQNAFIPEEKRGISDWSGN